MERFKFGAGIVLGGCLVLFALQNLAEVELTFMVWSFQSRRFVVIGVSFLVGLTIGWLIAVRRKRHDPAKRAEEKSTDG